MTIVHYFSSTCLTSLILRLSISTNYQFNIINVGGQRATNTYIGEANINFYKGGFWDTGMFPVVLFQIVGLHLASLPFSSTSFHVFLLRKPGMPNRPSTFAIFVRNKFHILALLLRSPPLAPKPPNAREWKFTMAFSYCTFRNTDVAASHPHRSASVRARTPISRLNLTSVINLRHRST